MAADGSHFAPERADPIVFSREGGDPPPDREWTLSAGQVTTVVLAILAACELIGALG